MAKPSKSVDLAVVRKRPAERASADPLPGRTAEAHARYEEYLRLLDEVPVLVDVVSEPPRVVIRDFRLGQRPNVRKAAREDAYVVREQQFADRERAYSEYERYGSDLPRAAAAPVRALPRKKKAKPSKGGKRATRRKR